MVLLKGVSKPIYCIVAVAQNGVIGSQGRLPWHIPEDLTWFMDQTEGGVMIEGPNCYQELGKALPGRGTVVVSRNEQKSFPGAERAKNLNDAIALAQSLPWTGPIWITGGERIYAEGLPHCTKLYITRIHRDFMGDRYFPHDWSRHFTKKVWSKDGREKDLSYTFEIWEK
jgi:dihydrofolate reductase